MTLVRSSLLVATLLLIVDRAPADPPTGFCLATTQGPVLEHWVAGGCDAAIDGETLVVTGQPGVVRSVYPQRDFSLRFDWRAADAVDWDAGILFRTALDADNEPIEAFEVSLRKGREGSCPQLDGARCEQLARPGQWNAMALTVVGAAATLEINGQRAWQVEGVDQPEGFIAIRTGALDGGRIELRNIRITEIGFRSLFSGRDLAGWEPTGQNDPPCWEVCDGLLVCTGRPGSWLRSTEQFGDFNLRLEYKLRDGGNSGVYCRVPRGGNHHGAGAGVEIQILDDAAERYQSLKPYQFSGGVYAVVPPSERVGRPAGQWNSLDILCRGPDYRVIQNGVTVVDATGENHPQLTQRALMGYLGLQNHREEVVFRSLRVFDGDYDAVRESTVR